MRRSRPLRSARRDRGSMAVEFVIAAPLLVVLLLLVSAGGEWLNVAGNVTAAARDSARAASLARTIDEAKAAATSAAAADLGGGCAAPGSGAMINLYRDGKPVSQNDFAAAQDIEVTVTCQASLKIYGHVGFHVSHTFTDTAVAPLDPFVDRG